MPKILQDLKPQLIMAANKLISEEGCEQLSIRAIAKECNIATGTIYNYFKNKEELFVEVILEGWQKYLSIMDEKCEQAESWPDAMAVICRCIIDFISEYRPIWRKFGSAGMSYSANSVYHGMLRQQIKDRVESSAKKRKVNLDDDVMNLLAETVLSAAIQRDLGEKAVYSLAKNITK